MARTIAIGKFALRGPADWSDNLSFNSEGKIESRRTTKRCSL